SVRRLSLRSIRCRAPRLPWFYETYMVFGVGLSVLRVRFTGLYTDIRRPKSGGREGQGPNGNRCAIRSANVFAGFPAQSASVSAMDCGACQTRVLQNGA